MNSQSSISFSSIPGELAAIPAVGPRFHGGASVAVPAARDGVWKIPSHIRPTLGWALSSVVAASGYPVIYYVAGGPLYGSIAIFLIALKYWAKEFSPKPATKAQL
jgi:hypothetical protein